jgi:hypothetical protein
MTTWSNGLLPVMTSKLKSLPKQLFHWLKVFTKNQLIHPWSLNTQNIQRRHLWKQYLNLLLVMTKYVHIFLFLAKLMLAQAISVVESPRLRKIFLLLREELKESDIPSRSTMRNRIEEAYEKHMKELQEEMEVTTVSYLV